jgi:hypothetical protein
MLDLICLLQKFVWHHIYISKVGYISQVVSYLIEINFEVLANTALIVVEKYEPRLFTDYCVGFRVNYQGIVVCIINSSWLEFDLYVFVKVPVFAESIFLLAKYKEEE